MACLELYIRMGQAEMLPYGTDGAPSCVECARVPRCAYGGVVCGPRGVCGADAR